MQHVIKSLNSFHWTALVFFVTLSTLGSCTERKGSNDTATSKAVKKEANNKIPGLEPVDVYLNLEKQNFETNKNLTSEYGNTWECKSSEAGINYIVSIYSTDVQSVESIRATAMLNGNERKQIIASKPFLKYIVSIPFDGNDPNKVAEWIDKNFDNDKQSLIVAGVKFTIYSPTKLVRMINIEKVN